MTNPFPFTPSGLRLLEYINNQVKKYGPMNLANLIEAELNNKHRCFKKNCAYCNYFRTEYSQPLPPGTMTIPMQSDEVITGKRIWTPREDEVILNMYNREIVDIQRILCTRSYAAIKQRRARLYKNNVMLVRRFGTYLVT